MKKTGKNNASSWGWQVWSVVLLGMIIFALPIPVNIRFWLMLPLMGFFIYVYNKFGRKRKSS
mgnify:CR=1 FL=1